VVELKGLEPLTYSMRTSRLGRSLRFTALVSKEEAAAFLGELRDLISRRNWLLDL
jgi:hypothetical protein